ncbi:hypothetical protein GCM10023330_29470 [Litoribaculum gwangyangense]|uniref:DUF2400 family protein n=1 Tax=Litoribaculum gwangyangense TaxID=1130722 RepID=A0ABP9CTG7_9FLAO
MLDKTQSLSYKLSNSELKDFLDIKVEQYNNIKFIESDPIQIPHTFSLKEDIEISGFLTATIAWGNRKSIINNASILMHLLDNAPFDFVLNHQETDLKKLKPFVHRTFNGDDSIQFIKSLQHIYKNHNGLEAVFSKHANKESMQKAISEFKSIFLNLNIYNAH